jgi:hypothetical protein
MPAQPPAEAHVLIFIDVTQDPPTVTRAGIYSAAQVDLAPKDHARLRIVDLLAVQAESFKKAGAQLAHVVATAPELQWVHRLIQKTRAQRKG